MSDRCYVATRKGLFTVERAANRWDVTGAAFPGDPVTMLLEDGRDDTLYAGLKLGHFGAKLHRSDDGGASWKETGCPAFPKKDDDGDDDGPAVKQIWALAAGGKDQPGLLWAGTIPGGLFVSRNSGESWELVESLWNLPERERWFGGGYPEPGIHSICVDPRDSRRVLVGVSCGGAWLTTDGGESWRCASKGMFAAYMPPDQRDDPVIQDPHLIVQCPAKPDVYWSQHHNGVFRTEDGAESWHEVPTVEPSVFGFATAVHPDDPDTAWFVPAIEDQCRIPVDGRVVVARTRDGGKSFEQLDQGLPGEHAYDLVFRHALDVDAKGDTLAMGSTTGNLWVGEGQGDRWRTVSSHLPPIYQVLFAR